MSEKYQWPVGKSYPADTMGFEWVKAPEIKPWECWTPFWVQKSSIVPWVNDYITRVQGVLEKNKSST